MQFTGLIRKVFATKILLSGKFSPFLTLLSILMKGNVFNLNRAVQFLESQLEKFLLDFEETSERNGESFSPVDC